jgi:hypothetical protein
MAALASSQHFVASTLLTQRATVSNVSGAIKDAAAKLKEGDIFFLTYSGHGGQVPDANADEPDGKDETWCLYDRMLIDDELAVLWAEFRAGVRILVLSDSCHSGTVTKSLEVFREIPSDILRRCSRSHKNAYDNISMANKRAPNRAPITATVRLISGCQDNQLSADGDANGLFTATLLAVWNSGRFIGNYRQFAKAIVKRMPAQQTPNHIIIGPPNAIFDAQHPFEI